MRRQPDGDRFRTPPAPRYAAQAQLIASVVVRKKEVLLRSYRRALRAVDLEECFSQAVLELLLRAREGRWFLGETHVERALEQKLRSRIADRVRALAGRSPIAAAFERALANADGDALLCSLEDRGPGVEEQVICQERLATIIRATALLGPDQRLALIANAFEGLSPRAVRSRWGWSEDKRRKVLTQARQKLKLLAGERAADV